MKIKEHVVSRKWSLPSALLAILAITGFLMGQASTQPMSQDTGNGSAGSVFVLGANGRVIGPGNPAVVADSASETANKNLDYVVSAVAQATIAPDPNHTATLASRFGVTIPANVVRLWIKSTNGLTINWGLGDANASSPPLDAAGENLPVSASNLPRLYAADANAVAKLYVCIPRN